MKTSHILIGAAVLAGVAYYCSKNATARASIASLADKVRGVFGSSSSTSKDAAEPAPPTALASAGGLDITSSHADETLSIG